MDMPKIGEHAMQHHHHHHTHMHGKMEEHNELKIHNKEEIDY